MAVSFYIVEIDQDNYCCGISEKFVPCLNVDSISEICECYDLTDDDVTVTYVQVMYDDGESGDCVALYDEEYGEELLKLYQEDDSKFTYLESGTKYYTAEELGFETEE